MMRPGGANYPRHAAGGGGDLDQPLAQSFKALSLASSASGPESQFMPEILPRPTNEDLSDPQRWEARSGPDGKLDKALCHPRLMRMTVNALPNNTGTKAKAGLPIGAIIQPLAVADDLTVPVVNFGASGVVRCRRCRTYMNPFVQFVDSGRRWRCNVCSLVNDLPGDYVCELDANGQRRDRMERPELHLGAVEFVAPAEYMVRPPQPPVFLFVVEVSYTAVSSGMLRCMASTIRHTLDRLPGGERTQVGLITFDTSLHFYNLNGSSPQMLVVPELDEVFLPMPNDLLVNLVDHKEHVATLLERLPDMFAGSQSGEVALGPALKAAFQIQQHVGGKMHVFSCTRPTVGEGLVRMRDNSSASAKDDKSATLLQPDTDFYKNLAIECSKQQVCVDLWNCAAAYSDLATVGQLAKHTGGSVYHYPAFSDVTSGEHLSRDLQHNLLRMQGLEAVMRVRASRGLRIANFYGHFFIRGVDLLAVPNVDEDKTFAVEISHEENALNATSACLQAALLYTTTCGERRIRVLTMEVPVTSAITSLYEAADVEACTSLMARVAAEAALNSKLLDGAEKLQTSCTELLRKYRALCPPQAKTSAQILLPDSLKLLPFYVLALMKSALFAQSSEVSADRRSYLFYMLSTMSCHRTIAMIHPRLFQVYPQQPAALPSGLPQPLPLTARSVQEAGAFLVDDGISLSLWLGHAVPPDFLQAVFGTPTLENVDPATLNLSPAESSPSARHIHEIIATIRAERSWAWLPLRVRKQGHADGAFVRALVEDQTKQMMSYNEFMVHCHRYVLSRVS